MNLEKTIAENYESIETQKVTHLNKKQDKRTDDLFSLLKELLPKQEKMSLPWQYKKENDIYLRTLNLIKEKEMNISPEYITEFVFSLADLQKEYFFFLKYCGQTISALINVHYRYTQYEEEYLIPTPHFKSDIDSIGYRLNGAKIRIEGNAGNDTGTDLKQGNILITGNCLSAGMNMAGGTIEIKKNVEFAVGSGMGGGSIHVQGNINSIFGGIAAGMNGGIIFICGNGGKYACNSMKGGEVIIGGDLLDHCFERMYGGTVTVLGKCKNTIAKEMYGGTLNLTYVPKISKLKRDGEIYCQGKRIS